MEMLRLWEEMSPLHQFDYDIYMDEIYLEIGEEVCNNNVVTLIVYEFIAGELLMYISLDVFIWLKCRGHTPGRPELRRFGNYVIASTADRKELEILSFICKDF